jgi:hypothetical protein
MKAISNLKIDKVVVWGGTESGKVESPACS